jgi:hypothetical protein
MGVSCRFGVGLWVGRRSVDRKDVCLGCAGSKLYVDIMLGWLYIWNVEEYLGGNAAH